MAELTPMPARGLYVVTDPLLCADCGVLSAIEQAIRGGAAAIQYRNKCTDAATRLDEATRLLELCRTHAVPLVINDDVDLAARIGADGVHVGRDDPHVRSVRSRLGRDAIVGASCYDCAARADAAERDGADYVAFGSFFPSPTKPQAVRADPRLLGAARGVAVVAIGGITAANAASLLRAGADLLAVAHGVLGQPDRQAAARALVDLFESSTVEGGIR